MMKCAMYFAVRSLSMFFIFYKLPTATKVFVYRDFALANVNSLKLS